MDVTTYIIIFVALSIGVGILRRFFTWADWLPYIAIPASTALMWYLNGAGAGIGTFFLSLCTMAYLTGIMAKTTVHYNRGRYSLDCPKCSYGNLEILSQDDNVVKVKCKRCGKVSVWKLNDGSTSMSTSSYSSSSSSRSSSYSSSSSSDDERRSLYQRYMSDANEAYSRYQDYKSDADSALRQARSYQDYANSYRGSDDWADKQTVESYDNKAEIELSRAEDYSREASRYYDQYRHYKSLAERYQ